MRNRNGSNIFMIFLVACLVMTGLSVGAAQSGMLELTVLGKLQTGNRTPVQDVLTPIWREKTKVIPKIIEIPQGQNFDEWIQMQIVAGTWPQICAMTNGVVELTNRYDMLKDAGLFREIKLSELERYMPLTKKRLAKYGITVKEWYEANVDYRDNKLYMVPNFPQAVLNPEYRDLRIVKARTGDPPYRMWFRDDILKKIFPNVKTEAELKALWLKKDGKLTPEDVLDIPIKNANDFYNYLKKVKALNLKVGNNPVIPCHPNLNNSAGALMWSLYTFPGFWWDEIADRLHSLANKSFVHFCLTPEWKEYIKWMNKSFNEGLFGEEMYIQTDDQKNAKVINGEYAAFQMWMPAADAKTLSDKEKRGYGYRVVPIFLIDLKTAYQDKSRVAYSLRNSWGGKTINPKKVKQSDVPKILKWIDWNYSEEAAELRAWGPPYMSTGTGENRRFKPEYKEVEQFLLTGKTGVKDGIYYGLYTGTAGSFDVYWNHETYGLTAASEFDYAYSPQFIYPYDDSNWDCGRFSEWAIKDYYRPKQQMFIEKALGKDARDAKNAWMEVDTEYSKLTKGAGWGCDQANLAVIKCITDKPENFEVNYAEFLKVFTPELRANLEKQKPLWLKYQELQEKYWKPVK